MKPRNALALSAAFIIVQAVGAASAEDGSRHDAERPGIGQENLQPSAKTETTDQKSKPMADQPPKHGHIEKNQTQSFQFSSGSRF